jgi:PiT family inorganic phosphate transporter
MPVSKQSNGWTDVAGMAISLVLIAAIVVGLALFFDFTNGFHDASSVVATVIASGALDIRKAIMFAATFTLLGALVGGSAVIYTVQKIILIEPGHTLLVTLLTGLIGATIWNMFTWKVGMPSSSTHALIGSLVGAAIVSQGIYQVQWGFTAVMGPDHHISGVLKVLIALLISPPIGFGMAFALQKGITFSLRNKTRRANKWLKRLQWGTVALLAYSQGANDTQKHMGVIMLALLSAGLVSGTDVPFAIRIVTGVIMLMGYLGGGWTIMKTLGQKIYRLEPIHSLSSQVSSATAVLTSTLLGGPISTTQVVGSSVLGVGAGDRVRMVSWRVGEEMLLSWFITIPANRIYNLTGQ